MKKLAKYVNGNVITAIFDDGTKIHYTNDDEFNFSYSESNDISISQCCDNGCEWCYYGCSPTGKHGKLDGWKFFDTMHPHTEIAINLQRPWHPDIIHFLLEMQKRNIIVNATINQRHFMTSDGKLLISHLVEGGLIHGIGISVTDPFSKGFIEEVKKYPNAVLHVIAGIIHPEDLYAMRDKGLKILILGYKQTNRGDDYYKDHCLWISDNISWLKSGLRKIVDGFDVVSFDNLALEQLDVKNSGILTDDEWEQFYAGDDGTLTFYIDLVKGAFARNSMSQIVYPIGDKTIDEMFDIVKKEVANEK